MLALALALRGRGHDVTLAAPPNFREWIDGFGFAFYPVGVDIQAAMRDVYKDAHRLSVALTFIRSVIWDQFPAIDAIPDDFDLYVGGGLQCAVQARAERDGRPYAYVANIPCMLRSAHHAPPFFKPQRLPRLANRALWSVYVILGNRATREVVNRGRASYGLTPLRDWYSAVFEPGCVLLAADSELGPKPPDVGGHVSSLGFLFLEDPTPLPADLTAFLDAGPAPVYVGFGSVPLDDVAAIDRLIGRSAELIDRRLVVQAGPTDLGRSIAGSRCFVAGPVDHHKLFPRCAAVVHHGGAGTTAAATRAGIPQVVVPHAADQFYWGHRVEVVGIGAPALPFRDLDARRLAARISTVTDTPGLLERARVLASRLAATDAAMVAAEALEGLSPP